MLERCKFTIFSFSFCLNYNIFFTAITNTLILLRLQTPLTNLYTKSFDPFKTLLSNRFFLFQKKITVNNPNEILCHKVVLHYLCKEISLNEKSN